MVIRKLAKSDPIPYHLLLMADPSKKIIDTYIFNSDVYVSENSALITGCYVLYQIDNEVMEIKNIVVDEASQGKGLGTRLLHDAIGRAKSTGCKRVIIGTGNSSVGQLYLYQKVGFRITGINPNFFSHHYPETIMENGIECRDRIILTKEL